MESAEITDGVPAIACQYGDQGLLYIEATDASGSAWWPPETVDTWMQAGNPLSMEDFLGRPLIEYSGQVYNAQLRAAYLPGPTH